MPSRLVLTSSTAAGLIALFWLYSKIVTPLVSPPEIEVPYGQSPFAGIRDEPGAPPRNRSQAEKYLPHVPWAADAKLQLHDGQTTFFAEEWETTESDKAVRLWPFAMIWFSENSDPEEKPITIVADSAIIRFAEKFDSSNPNPGRPIGGQFLRRVRIDGPDGLAVVGRNFLFEEAAMHIHSENALQFAYGKHRGRATGVNIKLRPAAEEEETSDLAVDGVESLRLLRDVTMDLVFEDDDDDDDTVYLHVTSRGSFRYDLENGSATFEDSVRVIRPTSPEFKDSLDCDLLTLIFQTEEEEEAEQANETVADGSNLVAQDDERIDGAPRDLLRVIAEGHAVILGSQENNLVARARHFVYDRPYRRARLTENVKVIHSGSRVACPELTISHDEDGHIDRAWCKGPGTLNHYSQESEQQVLESSWTNLLRTYPDPANADLRVIELNENAIVRQREQQSRLQADLIKLWVRETEDDQSDHSEADDGDLDLRKMLASGNVVAASPGFSGHTPRLEVWFEQRPQRPPETQQGQPPGSPNSPAGPSNSQSTATANADSDSRSDRPMLVEADWIQVNMLQFDGESEPVLDQLRANGHVRAESPGEGEDPPLEFTGNRFELQSKGTNDQVVGLFGTPALILNGQIQLEGPEIHLDRASNRAWMIGVGALQLPVERDLEGNPLSEPDILDVRWTEQMDFNGASASFFGDVRAFLRDGEDRMRCHEMTVSLSEPISFIESDSSDQNVEVQSIDCKEGVTFHSSLFENNDLIGIRKAAFWEFSLNQQTGETRGRGPGWIIFWERDQGRPSAFAPTAVVKANQPRQSDKSEWNYTRIDFVGDANGNVNDGHMTFHNRVYVVHGPVKGPNDTIDPDNLGENAGSMKSDVLQLTRQELPESDETYVELLASGNAKLEGQTFHARSDQIKYDESSMLFILRSLGNREATIWRQLEVGAQHQRSDAKSIHFNPSQNRMELHGATGVDGFQ